MCILIAKKSNARKLTEQEIRTSAKHNPDGCGIAWCRKGKVYTFKTQNVDEIIKLNNSLDADAPIIYHFRIATHGKVNLDNCHPFYDKGLNIAFAHNGILSIENYKEKDWTDSETAFRFLFVPILHTCSIDSKEFSLAVNTIIGSSKFAFLQGNGNIKTFGNFIEDDGVLFSNSSYKEIDYSTFKFGNYLGGCYDDYYGDYGYDLWDTPKWSKSKRKKSKSKSNDTEAWMQQYDAASTDVSEYVYEFIYDDASCESGIIDKDTADWLIDQMITDLSPIYDMITYEEFKAMFYKSCDENGIEVATK